METLLRKAAITAEAVTAIGSHGQTIHHRPDATHPFTLQIGDPNRFAALTGITTVADFRRPDMAVGGPGAPLAPAIHKTVFASTAENRAILNIGGIANLTRLPADPAEAVSDFDTGPGNRLLDDWIAHIRGKPTTGMVPGQRAARSSRNCSNAFCPTPGSSCRRRSTGTERFNLEWVREKLDTLASTLKPEDVQATLLELTAVTIDDAVRAFCTGTERLLTCGGGAHNRLLLERIASLLPGVQTDTTAVEGLDPDWVEAAAFPGSPGARLTRVLHPGTR